MLEHPLITVVTLVYNTAKVISRTLHSIKSQTYPNIQHIIIDDASSDDSVAIVKQWIKLNNHNCTFIEHHINKGICATLNEALSLAKGKYFTVIGDDVMVQCKLEKDVQLLERHQKAAFCYSKMISSYIDKGTDVCGSYAGSINPFHDYISGNLTIAAPTVTYRRTVFADVGLYDESLLFEDYDMFLRILYKYEAIFADYFSIFYTRNGNSIQINKELKFINEFFNVLKKWRFLPKYRFYKNNRHQYTFCHLAVKNKREAFKHLLPACAVFWKFRLYKNIIKLFFVWK